MHNLPCETQVPGVLTDKKVTTDAEPGLLKLPKADVTIILDKVCKATIVFQCVSCDNIF